MIQVFCFVIFSRSVLCCFRCSTVHLCVSRLLQFIGPDGRCYKTLKIDPLVILKTQIESLLKKNRTATTEYDEDYDYSEYSESTESMNTNGQYTIPLSFGFGNDHRPIHLQQQQQQQLQQQQQQMFTTFPNLNRVVKDDSHIASGLHVSSEKENQPFLVSTTGLGLDSEVADNDNDDDGGEDERDFVIEAKSETSTSGTSSSVATASSMVASSSTPAAINAIETEPSSSTASITDDNSASTNVAADTMATVQESSPQTTIVSAHTEEIAPKIVTNSIKTVASDHFDTEPLEFITTAANSSPEKLPLTATEQDHTIVAANTDPIETVSPTTNGYSSETLTINSKIVATSPAAAAAATTNTMDATQTDDANAQSSTNIPIESIEQQQEHNDSLTQQLPTLSQTIEKFVEIQQNYRKHETNAEDSPPAEPTEKQIDQMTEANIDDTGGNIDDVPTTMQAQPDVESAPSSTFTDPLAATNQTETNETSDDAVFIPSQFVETDLTDDLEPSAGSNADEMPKYHVENVSTASSSSSPAVVDDELAELAPIIDTAKRPPIPRANIELIDDLNESAQPHSSGEDDEVKNFSARLADELLFLGVAKENQAPSPLPLTSSPTSDTSKALFEETLNGVPTLGIGLNSNEMTTEESIEYDLNETKLDRSSDETSKNADYDSVSLEPPPISLAAVEPTQQQQPKPSIYIDFMNRLKYAPPIVDLRVDSSNRPKYAHSPFDLASAIQNANQRSTTPVVVASSSSSTPPPPSPEQSATTVNAIVSNSQSTGHIESSSERGNDNRHQLQIGINCYLRNLVNKQQYIICDNA